MLSKGRTQIIIDSYSQNPVGKADEGMAFDMSSHGGLMAACSCRQKLQLAPPMLGTYPISVSVFVSGGNHVGNTHVICHKAIQYNTGHQYLFSIYVIVFVIVFVFVSVFVFRKAWQLTAVYKCGPVPALVECRRVPALVNVRD